VADGRNALARSDELYDIIEMDALHVESAYSGNLYSLEFFQLASRRLAPGGVMSIWGATPRVYATFAKAFPHVLGFLEDSILIGGRRPFPVEPSVWKERALSGPVRAYLGPQNSRDIMRALDTWKPASPDRVPGVALNRDLFPRDELSVR
jgi:hypothetical protein